MEHHQNWVNINSILYHQYLFYVPKIIRTELINKYYNKPLVNHFVSKNTQNL